MNPSFVYLAIAALLLTGTTAVHGIWTGRWQGVDPVRDRADLNRLPLKIGSWEGEELPSRPDKEDEGVASIVRKYALPGSEKVVLMVLTTGVAGLVSVHTPDICYTGSGYSMKLPVRRDGIAGGQFYAARFRKATTTDVQNLLIRWGWTTNGAWEAPDSPRWHYAGRSKLYKLYLITPLAEDTLETDDPAIARFQEQLVQSINRTFALPQ